MSLRKLSIVFFIGLLLAAAGTVFFFQSHPQKPVKIATPSEAYVEAARVKSTSWQPEIKSTGTLVSNQGVQIHSPISNNIKSIQFQSGQDVKAGDVLFTLDDTVLQANLNSARAQYNLDKLTYDRNLSLLKKQVISQSTLDSTEATLQVSKAALEKAEAEFDETIIRAPFSGHMGLIQVNLRDYVTPSQTLVKLEDDDPMRVDFSVPETFLAKLAKGQQVRITTAALPGKIFWGKVAAIDTSISVENRTINLRAYIDNPKHILVPGSFAEVNLLVGTPQNVIYIPQTALQYSAEGTYVFRIIDSKAQKTLITLGEQRDTNIAVKQGLKIDDIIAISGIMKLHDGMPVHIVGDIV